MADGFAPRAALTHADGIYIDMPERDYLADRALSGSAFKMLLASPPDWWFAGQQLEEPDFSEAKALGTFVHKAALEGLDAFEASYCRAPAKIDHPGALDTAEELKEWLRAARAKAEEGGKLSREDAQPFLLTGKREELIDRVLALDPRAPIWDAIKDGIVGGRQVISKFVDAQCRLVERFLREDATFSKLLSGGLPEVSIFWTDEGVRFKARIDYLRPTAVIDLKTFGDPPKRGVLRHVLGAAATYGYDIQAVHNWRAAARIPSLLATAEVVSRSSEKIAALERMALGEKVFIWLFVRVKGGPLAIAPRFDRGGYVWNAAEQKIARAVERFRAYRDRFGEAMWCDALGVVDPDISEWPPWVTEVPE